MGNIFNSMLCDKIIFFKLIGMVQVMKTLKNVSLKDSFHNIKKESF